MRNDEDDDAAPADVATLAKMRELAPVLQNGTFTVSHEQHGHFTVKLHTAKNGDLAGKRILSLLVGPQNETDYRGVAFWDDAKRVAYVWKRFKGEHRERLPIDGYSWDEEFSTIEKKLSILIDLAIRRERGHWTPRGYKLHLEGRCLICNRKLTTPESIELGIGPICANRAGAA